MAGKITRVPPTCKVCGLDLSCPGLPNESMTATKYSHTPSNAEHLEEAIWTFDNGLTGGVIQVKQTRKPGAALSAITIQSSSYKKANLVTIVTPKGKEAMPASHCYRLYQNAWPADVGLVVND